MSKAGSICVFCCYFNEYYSEILYEYRNSDSSAFTHKGAIEDQYSAVDDPQDCRLLGAEEAPRNHPVSPPLFILQMRKTGT